MSILKFVRSKRGQSVVEFTMAAPLFFLALFAIVEFSHLVYVRLTLQHALSEAGRYMATGRGQSLSDPNARLNAVKDVFCANLVATGLSCPNLNDPKFQFNPANGGAPGEVVTVTATFSKPFFTGVFRLFDPLFPAAITFTLSTVWQNEPYVTV